VNSDGPQVHDHVLLRRSVVVSVREAQEQVCLPCLHQYAHPQHRPDLLSIPHPLPHRTPPFSTPQPLPCIPPTLLRQLSTPLDGEVKILLSECSLRQWEQLPGGGSLQLKSNCDSPGQTCKLRALFGELAVHRKYTEAPSPVFQRNYHGLYLRSVSISFITAGGDFTCKEYNCSSFRAPDPVDH